MNIIIIIVYFIIFIVIFIIFNHIEYLILIREVDIFSHGLITIDTILTWSMLKSTDNSFLNIITIQFMRNILSILDKFGFFILIIIIMIFIFIFIIIFNYSVNFFVIILVIMIIIIILMIIFIIIFYRMVTQIWNRFYYLFFINFLYYFAIWLGDLYYFVLFNFRKAFKLGRMLYNLLFMNFSCGLLLGFFLSEGLRI